MPCRIRNSFLNHPWLTCYFAGFPYLLSYLFLQISPELWEASPMIIYFKNIHCFITLVKRLPFLSVSEYLPCACLLKLTEKNCHCP